MEKSKKEKFGIIIAFHDTGKGITPLHHISVEVMLGRQSDKKKGQIFYPSEAVEHYLKSKEVKLPHQTGDARLYINEGRNEVEWVRFYPGFRDRDLGKKVLPPLWTQQSLQEYSKNTRVIQSAILVIQSAILRQTISEMKC